jgi:hypothetical protein
MMGAGCGTSQPPAPPPLPELATPLPGPPPASEPAVLDQDELTLLTEDGEPLDEVDPETPFRAIFRFHLVSPPEEDFSSLRIRVIAYVQDTPTTAWNCSCRLIPEGNDVYRYEGELKSPPKTGRQYFVRAEIGGNVLVEEPIVIR